MNEQMCNFGVNMVNKVHPNINRGTYVPATVCVRCVSRRMSRRTCHGKAACRRGEAACRGEGFAAALRATQRSRGLATRPAGGHS